jgi:hypothetical protein
MLQSILDHSLSWTQRILDTHATDPPNRGAKKCFQLHPRHAPYFLLGSPALISRGEPCRNADQNEKAASELGSTISFHICLFQETLRKEESIQQGPLFRTSEGTEIPPTPGAHIEQKPNKELASKGPEQPTALP